MKAALVSCLVFPGAGHLYLRRFTLGFLLSVGAAAALYFIAMNAVQAALEITEQIQKADAPLEINAILELLSQHSRKAEAASRTPGIALAMLWLIGILDSYRVGRGLDNAQKGAGEKRT